MRIFRRFIIAAVTLAAAVDASGTHSEEKSDPPKAMVMASFTLHDGSIGYGHVPPPPACTPPGGKRIDGKLQDQEPAKEQCKGNDSPLMKEDAQLRALEKSGATPPPPPMEGLVKLSSEVERLRDACAKSKPPRVRDIQEQMDKCPLKESRFAKLVQYGFSEDEYYLNLLTMAACYDGYRRQVHEYPYATIDELIVRDQKLLKKGALELGLTGDDALDLELEGEKLDERLPGGRTRKGTFEPEIIPLWKDEMKWRERLLAIDDPEIRAEKLANRKAELLIKEKAIVELKEWNIRKANLSQKERELEKLISTQEKQKSASPETKPKAEATEPAGASIVAEAFAKFGNGNWGDWIPRLSWFS